jgi:hypothetical protein
MTSCYTRYKGKTIDGTGAIDLKMIDIPNEKQTMKTVFSK